MTDDALEGLNKMSKEALVMLNKQLMLQLKEVEKSQKALMAKTLQDKKSNNDKY